MNIDSNYINELCEKHTPMIHAIASNLFIKGASKDDLIQEGYIGMIKGIKNYSEDSGASFESFIFMCARRNMLTAIKKMTSIKSSMIGQVSTEEDVYSFYYDESAPCAEDSMAMKDLLKRIDNEKADIFSSSEQAVLNLMLQSMSYSEISDVLNIPKKTADNAVQRVKKKLRIAYPEYSDIIKK